MLSIAANEIHTWQIDQAGFDLSELEASCLDWLTDKEMVRYKRFSFDQHRKQFLLGRIFVRKTLSEYAEVAPAEWKFIENVYGKPAIEPAQNQSALYFNLSHSGDRQVLVLANKEDIGVDIEFCNKPRRVIKISDRYFSSAEQKELVALPEKSQLSRFYDLWTLKEAYIKACGLGLAIHLHQFSYRFPSEYRVLIEFAEELGDDATQWQFWQLDPGGPFKMAVAIKSGEHKIESIISRQFLSFDGFVRTESKILRD